MKIVKVSLEAQRVQFGSLDPGDCFIDEIYTARPDMSFVQIKLNEKGAVFLEDGSQESKIDNKDWVYYATEVILGVE